VAFFYTECGSSVSWFESILVLSFLLLQGCCRRYLSPIPFRHPLMGEISGLKAGKLGHEE